MDTITVRRAGAADVSGIAEIHVRSWQAAYRGVLPDALLDALSVPEREDHWQTILSGASEHRLTLVADDPGGGLTGFCSALMPSPDGKAGAATAEIGALYVDPNCWGRGVGTAVLTAALKELREQGWADAILWVLPENHAALAFYDHLGFAVEKGIEKNEERSGRPVIRLRIALADFHARTLPRTESTASDEPIRLAPPDPDWPLRFEQERAALDGAIGEWVCGGIHHVGSTAVPGLEAKPIIDILAGVRDLKTARACFDPLADLDYLYAPYLPEEMHWFCKPDPARRTHHLHLVPADSQRYRDELAFRDRLRADPQIASGYAALKRELAERHRDDREGYTEAKGAFVRATLAQIVKLPSSTA
jgi:GrpB-like predicted nucleotidyltransferase (UPF0157 family)/ribosomal protein S18 acetylase RimI-like enzyme